MTTETTALTVQDRAALALESSTAETHRFLRIRVNRDEAFIAQLEAAVLEAEVAAQELQAKLERIAA